MTGRTSRGRWRPTSRSSSEIAYSARSSRGAFASRRHRALESRFWLTIRAAKAPKATSNWQKKFSTMNRTESQRKALGRGMNALLAGRTQAPAVPQPTDGRTAETEAAREVAIDAIDPNPLQPRRAFQADRLAELAQSIRANGIVQPLVVRQAGERYQLIAGERRSWQAWSGCRLSCAIFRKTGCSKSRWSRTSSARI